MPKVSVIIPVFGVEKYIERCARSLFEQTLDDIEFIFVDDCTNDDSISVLQKVLMEYPNRNNQTKIVHHDVNKGLPAARQTGLRIASGEYVAHCDSDDWVERSIYADMYEKASEEEADIVICDYNQTDGKTFRKTFCACHDTSITSYIENCLFGVDSWVVWNKLVKQSIYEGIVFPVSSMGEDMVISIQVLSRCSKLFYIPKPYYNYYYNMNSMTNMPTEDQCFIRFNQMKTNVDCLTSALSVFDLSGKTQEGLIYLKYKALSLLIPIIHKRKYYNVWMSTYKGLYKSLLPSKHIAFNIKIKFLLTALRLYPIYKYSLKSDFEANR